MPNPIDPQALQKIAADLRGHAVTDERAAQLALDVARINDAARAEGAQNDFNAQPSDFALALVRLSETPRKTRR